MQHLRSHRHHPLKTRIRWTFLRHGESTANAEGWISGHTDVPLTARGRQQALAACDPLRDLPFERVVVSDLRRAYDTATLAAPHHTPRIHAGLRERAFGDWEGLSRQAMVQRGHQDALLTFSARPPGGESLADLVQRALRTLVELESEAPGVETLVVGHGGLLRAILGSIDDMAQPQAARLRIPNCGLQTRSLEPGTWADLLHTVENRRSRLGSGG